MEYNVHNTIIHMLHAIIWYDSRDNKENNKLPVNKVLIVRSLIAQIRSLIALQPHY